MVSLNPTQRAKFTRDFRTFLTNVDCPAMDDIVMTMNADRKRRFWQTLL